MVTAFVLLSVERDKIEEIAQDLSDMNGVSEVYSVSGSYDLIAIARVSNNEKLADLVTGRMLKINGIIRSETMLAFRTFSRHDLGSMFSVGFDNEV